MTLSLNFLNESYTFQMVHNIGLLSHNYILEEVREDSVLEEVPSVAKDCYYSKNIKGKVLSAITICNNNVVSI